MSEFKANLPELGSPAHSHEVSASQVLSVEAVLSVNLDGRVTAVNASAKALFGAAGLDPRDQPLEFLLPPNDRRQKGELTSMAASCDAVPPYMTQLLLRDGTRRDLVVCVYPTTDTAGRRNGATVTVRRSSADHELQEALREALDFKTALDEHAIVAITDPQGRITYVNDKFVSISKYSRSELMGKDHRIVNSGHHPKELFKEMWRTIAGGKVWRGEIKNRAKDGTFYWVDATIVPFLNEDGSPKQYLAIRSDITKRKEAEEELRSSEARLRNMISSVRDYSIVMLDKQGTIKDWNRGAEAIKGWGAHEIIGRNFTSFYSPEDIAAGRPEHMLRVAAAEGRSEDEGWRLRKNGSAFWANVIITALHEADGTLMGFVKVTCDLTGRKQAEDDLRQSLKQISEFKAALDEHSIVAMTDTNGTITYVNDKYCAISGYSRDELIGVDQRIVSSGYHPKAYYETLWRTITAGRVWHGVFRNRTKGGSYYWLETTVVPFLDDAGRGRQFIAISADITLLKNAEAAIQRTADDLSRSNRDLEQFAYVASHDLQEPLRAISGCLQVFERRYRGQIDQRADELIGHAVDGSNRMRTLIEGLLAFSRIEVQGGDYVPVEMEAIVDQALQNLSSSIAESRAVVTRDRLPRLVADPLQLSLLLQNLVGNAIKFHSDQTPEVHISANREANAWTLSVRDNGIGIAPEYFERIFVIFQRLHTRTEFKGTGLGLAICKKIAERHGGQIWVESASGKGSTFHVRLPDRTSSKGDPSRILPFQVTS